MTNLNRGFQTLENIEIKFHDVVTMIISIFRSGLMAVSLNHLSLHLLHEG